MVGDVLLPDYQELRTQANAIKKHSIENLDYYLEEFERNAIKNGATVHWAKDAADHNQMLTFQSHSHLRKNELHGDDRAESDLSLLDALVGLPDLVEPVRFGHDTHLSAGGDRKRLRRTGWAQSIARHRDECHPAKRRFECRRGRTDRPATRRRTARR